MAKGSTAQQKSRSAANTAGAGSGSLLVLMAKNWPESSKWKQVVLVAAPILAVSLSDGLVWLRTVLAKRSDKKRRERDYMTAKKTLEDIINNPETPPKRKEECRKDLEKLEKFRIQVQLRSVFKE